MSSYEILDEIRDITNCPDGKSITQHVSALRAKVAELENELSESARLHGKGGEREAERAEAAEARVRELEATIDTMAEAHAHDDQALTAAYMNGAHEGKKQAEAERDALRERCEKLEHELGMSKRNEARWIEKGEEAISERNAANKALEAIKRHQEIVAGTGTAQLSTTWKIANDYLRSKGAALSATEVKP